MPPAPTRNRHDDNDSASGSRSHSVYSSFGIMQPGINRLNIKFTPVGCERRTSYQPGHQENTAQSSIGLNVMSVEKEKSMITQNHSKLTTG